MKITDDKSFDLEQFCATRASNQLRREQDYAQKARLERQSIADKKERDAKDQDEGFDEIKERQGLLLATAYEKFKSVAQDFDTTIAEILAIRDGQ